MYKHIYKKIINLLLELQKKDSKFFNFLVICNALCIKFYFCLFKPKILLDTYSRSFSVKGNNFIIKTLKESHLNEVYNFFKFSINTNSHDFIMPHKIDLPTLRTILNTPSNILLGIFHEDNFIGYALIRLLFLRKASYAIFIANEWQGKGIGTAALKEQLNLINALGFRPYSTVTKWNKKSLKMLKKLGIEFSADLGDYFVVKNMTVQKHLEDEEKV